MTVTMLLLTIATVIFAGGLLWAAWFYGHKALAEARNANALASQRSQVSWQAGRLTPDMAGALYVLNNGSDTAHDVTDIA